MKKITLLLVLVIFLLSACQPAAVPIEPAAPATSLLQHPQRKHLPQWKNQPPRLQLSQTHLLPLKVWEAPQNGLPNF
jgi:hypothetical protein